MSTKEFRAQLKEIKLHAVKRRKLEVLDVRMFDGSLVCTVTYAELHNVDTALDLLDKKGFSYH